MSTNSDLTHNIKKDKDIDKKRKGRSNMYSYIISEYDKYNISKPDIFFYICFFLTSYFLYRKITDRFIALWRVAFYPLYAYFILRSLITFYLITKNDNFTQSDENHDIFLTQSEIPNLANIYIISNFFKFILYLLILCFIYNIHSFLDDRNDDFLYTACMFLIAITIWGLIYSLIRLLPSMKIEEKKKSQNNSTIVAFVSSLLGPVLTYFSSMLIICSGGACTQIYISTITSILGAFGVTLSEFSKFLFPLTCVLLCISLLSLYIKMKKILHPPFLLGVFSACIILIGKYFDKSKLGKLVYPGNALMIAAAIWNARINKFSGLPVYNKSNKS